jgi:hypothetical protein
MRVSNILRRNGWIRVQKQIDNKRQRYWEKVEQEVEQPLNPLPISVSKESNKKVEQQVEQHLNPLSVKVLESTAPPAPPCSLNFSKNQENTTLDEHTADLTNATSENPKRFEVRGGAGGAAQIETSETPTVQGLQPAPPAAPPTAPPPCSLKVEQQVETSETPTVQGLDSASPPALPPQVTPEEFAEQIRKAIADFDRPLAIQVWDGLKAKVKRKLREEVKAHLTARESENFKILVTVGFLLDMRVKYVGDPKYAEQYEGQELQVYRMDEYFLITCRKPDGYLTTRMKPEELEKL